MVSIQSHPERLGVCTVFDSVFGEIHDESEISLCATTFGTYLLLAGEIGSNKRILVGLFGYVKALLSSSLQA